MTQNRIREIAETKDLILAGLARKMGISRSYLNKKMNLDDFTPEQKAIASAWCGEPEAELFPERLEIQA